MPKFQCKRGATRNVFLVGKYAIKIPRIYSWRTFLNGLLANLTEREFSSMCPQMLARVYYADILGLVIVMERADKVLHNDTRRVRAFFQSCEDLGLPADWNPWNIGVFGKKWKLIDYGTGR